MLCCLGDDTVDKGCIAIVSENPAKDPCQCDAELSCSANNKECLKYLCSIHREVFQCGNATAEHRLLLPVTVKQLMSVTP
jgi:hypothetical protein